MAILDFSVYGWHGFGSVTQVWFGISVSNFMCMSFVAVGRSLTIVSYVAFKMAALWFWTMFNCNPTIAHWHPLLWGGGILVDHWSTISSYFISSSSYCWNGFCATMLINVIRWHLVYDAGRQFAFVAFQGYQGPRWLRQALAAVACIAFVAPVCVGRLIAPSRLLPVTHMQPACGVTWNGLRGARLN